MMNILRLICFLTLFCVCFQQASASSLFFTNEQTQQIDEKVLNAPHKNAVQPKHLLHLSSIIFVGSNDWTIWLQGEKWTSSSRNPDIKIIHVSSEHVDLSVCLQGETMPRTFRLRPQQSLNLLTGALIEGL